MNVIIQEHRAETPNRPQHSVITKINGIEQAVQKHFERSGLKPFSLKKIRNKTENGKSKIFVTGQVQRGPVTFTFKAFTENKSKKI